MKKKIKDVIRDVIRMMLGRRFYTFLRFIIVHKYRPRFNNPKTFSEKIVYRKFHSDAQALSVLVDKHEVRKFVANTIGNEYLIPLIKVKDILEPADFIDLPKQFVIKTSNGGGGENVMIVRDKDSIDISKTCKKFNLYLKHKVGSKIDELFYDISKPKIIFEELIVNENGEIPTDFKVHVFNSMDDPVIYIQVDSDRFGDHKRSIYNEDLNRQDFKIQPKYSEIGDDFIFPGNMQELISKAKILSQGFKYVRVDMYNINGRILFGEMTFCHASGWEPIRPVYADYMLGKLWEEYN